MLGGAWGVSRNPGQRENARTPASRLRPRGALRRDLPPAETTDPAAPPSAFPAQPPSCPLRSQQNSEELPASAGDHTVPQVCPDCSQGL